MSGEERRLGVRAQQKRRWDRDHMLRSMRPQGQPGHLSAVEVQQLRQMRAGGMSVESIADVMLVRYGTVVRHTKDIT